MAAFILKNGEISYTTADAFEGLDREDWLLAEFPYKWASETAMRSLYSWNSGPSLNSPRYLLS